MDFTPNDYAEWRLRCGVLPMLREEAERPPEHLLQTIWHHQRLRREEFTTLDGRRLHVLHPGFLNREAGPDFLRAVLQFEGEPAQTCDVEVDLLSSGWRSHGHDRNPAFRKVALHVVWESDTPGSLPTLALRPHLDAPLEDLVLWLGSDPAQTFPGALAGACSAPLRGLEPARLTELLRQAALVRLRSKAAQFQARARQAGWEQALWEGIFRALGYKHNAWPMQRLAELRARLRPAEARSSLLGLQARLLGTAGLLPSDLARGRTAAAGYVRQLWDLWWRELEAFRDCTMPRSLWRFSGLRPANHPERRLALAAHWLHAGDLPVRLERWCRALPDSGSPAALLDVLQVEPDDFWSWHWTLRSKRLPGPQPLLGAARATDLAVNAVLPWLWVRAVEGRNETLQSALERCYLQWPASDDNAVLRLARQRLLGQAAPRVFRHAASQQGLLQMVRDFCEYSNALCTHCRFPELVSGWATPVPV